MTTCIIISPFVVQSPYRTLPRPSIMKGDILYMFSNDDLIKMTVDLTTAKLSNSTVSANEAGGEHVAEFIQKLYDKLAELNLKESD